MSYIKQWIKVFVLLLLSTIFGTFLHAGLAKCYAIPDDALEMHFIVPNPASPPTTATQINIAPNAAYGTSFSGEGGALSTVTDKVYLFECDGGDDNGDVDMWSVNTTTGATTLEVADIISNTAPGGDNRIFNGCVDGALFYINPARTLEILYVIGDDDSSDSARRLYAFDPQNSFALMAGYPVNLFGDRNRLDSIEYDVTVDKFYGANDGTAGIYEINITTGETTFTANTSSSIDAEAMGYGSDLRLYVEDEIGGGVVEIFTLNPDTGALTSAATYNNGGSDVETIACNVGAQDDLSDAPASYGFAAHRQPTLSITATPTYMGALDGDDDSVIGAASIYADSDDNDGNNDDDGVTVGGATLQNAVITGATVTIDISTNGAVDGVLNAWIDFNADGDFLDSGEQIATDVGGTTGGSITLVVAIPGGAINGPTFSRFRYSTVSGLSAFDNVAAGNSALNGEVEDYRINLGAPDISITKVSSPQNTPLQQGDTIDYIIRIENNATAGSNAILNNIVVNDNLPLGTSLNGVCNVSGWTYVSKTVTDDFNSNTFSGGVNWDGNWADFGETDGNVGDVVITSGRLRIQDNDGGQLGIQRTIDFTGYGTTAMLSFDSERVNLDNINDWVSVSVRVNGGAWTEIVRFAGPTNDGGTPQGFPATSVTIGNTTEIRFMGSPSLGGSDRVFFDNLQLIAENKIVNPITTCNAFSGLITVGNNFDLVPGDDMNITYQLIVDNPLASNIIEINNTVAVATDEFSTPITASTSDDVGNNADLVTVKTVDNSNPNEGNTVTFTIQVTNNGPRIATGVDLNDTLPVGVTFIGSSVSQGSYVVPVWTIGTLNDGEVAEINITATVD